MSNSGGRLRDLTSASCEVAFTLDAAKSAKEQVYYLDNKPFVPKKEREDNIARAEAAYDSLRQQYFDAIRALDADIAEIAAGEAEWEAAADGGDAGRLMMASAGDGNGSSTLKVLVPDVAMERIDVFVQRIMTEESQ